MLFERFAGDEYIVDVDEYARNVAKNFVHQPLKILAGIFQTEGGAREDPEPEGGDDRSLWDVLVGHRNLVVSLEEVHFGEVLFSVEFRSEVG